MIPYLEVQIQDDDILDIYRNFLSDILNIYIMKHKFCPFFLIYCRIP